MRYSIFDFDQQLCVDLKLTMDDLLLMDYIQKAIANPKMKHHKQEALYVWLNHKKILEDLPILNISEVTLKKHLKKLVDLGLLRRIVVSSNNSRGSRAYYGITDKFVDLQFSGVENDTRLSRPGVEKDTRSTGPGVENELSNNGLINNRINKLNKTNSINTISRRKSSSSSRKLVKKKSLYESCIELICLFTKDTKVRNLLEDYLKLRLEMKDKPLYKNQWKGILNKLDKIHEEEGQSYEDIIQFNIEKGYASFFPVPKYRSAGSGKQKRAYDDGVSSEKWTEEELKEIEKWEKEQLAKGERLVF